MNRLFERFFTSPIGKPRTLKYETDNNYGKWYGEEKQRRLGQGREARMRTTIYKYSCSFVKQKSWGGKMQGCKLGEEGESSGQTIMIMEGRGKQNKNKTRDGAVVQM